MGYQMASGQYANTRDVEVQASVTRTATANGAAVEVGDRGTLRLLLDVTARSGTSPSMTVAIETSYDGTTWRSVASFAAATAVGTERKSFTGIDRYVRAVATISGTSPSFTYSVSGEAV